MLIVIFSDLAGKATMHQSTYKVSNFEDCPPILYF